MNSFLLYLVFFWKYNIAHLPFPSISSTWCVIVTSSQDSIKIARPPFPHSFLVNSAMGPRARAAEFGRRVDMNLVVYCCSILVTLIPFLRPLIFSHHLTKDGNLPLTRPSSIYESQQSIKLFGEQRHWGRIYPVHILQKDSNVTKSREPSPSCKAMRCSVCDQLTPTGYLLRDLPQKQYFHICYCK